MRENSWVIHRFLSIHENGAGNKKKKKKRKECLVKEIGLDATTTTTQQRCNENEFYDISRFPSNFDTLFVNIFSLVTSFFRYSRDRSKRVGKRTRDGNESGMETELLPATRAKS